MSFIFFFYFSFIVENKNAEVFSILLKMTKEIPFIFSFSVWLKINHSFNNLKKMLRKQTIFRILSFVIFGVSFILNLVKNYVPFVKSNFILVEQGNESVYIVQKPMVEINNSQCSNFSASTGKTILEFAGDSTSFQLVVTHILYWLMQVITILLIVYGYREDGESSGSKRVFYTLRNL